MKFTCLAKIRLHIINEIESDIEEVQALDIDGEMDYEIDYAPGVNASA